jgi:hypothetical protein
MMAGSGFRKAMKGQLRASGEGGSPTCIHRLVLDEVDDESVPGERTSSYECGACGATFALVEVVATARAKKISMG